MHRRKPFKNRNTKLNEDQPAQKFGKINERQQ
jgi:hypothetical protein